MSTPGVNSTVAIRNATAPANTAKAPAKSWFSSLFPSKPPAPAVGGRRRKNTRKNNKKTGKTRSKKKCRY